MSFPTRPLTPTQTYSPIKSQVPEFHSTKKDVGIRASYQFQSTITQLLREDVVQQNDFSHVVEEKEKIAKLARSLLLSHKALKEELEEQKKNMDLKDAFNENMKNEVAVYAKRNAQLDAEVQQLRNEREKLQQQCLEMKNYAIECESRVDDMIMEKKVRREAEECEVMREHECKSHYETSNRALEDEIHRIKTFTSCRQNSQRKDGNTTRSSRR
jgi:predicted RNase H-like nuclease (RuvC/YqgF family)